MNLTLYSLVRMGRPLERFAGISGGFQSPGFQTKMFAGNSSGYGGSSQALHGSWGQTQIWILMNRAQIWIGKILFQMIWLQMEIRLMEINRKSVHYESTPWKKSTNEFATAYWSLLLNKKLHRKYTNFPTKKSLMQDLSIFRYSIIVL